jgi:hypothetical protein
MLLELRILDLFLGKQIVVFHNGTIQWTKKRDKTMQ